MIYLWKYYLDKYTIVVLMSIMCEFKHLLNHILIEEYLMNSLKGSLIVITILLLCTTGNVLTAYKYT